MIRIAYPIIVFSGAVFAVERPDDISPPTAKQEMLSSSAQVVAEEPLLPESKVATPELPQPEASESKAAWLGVAGDPIGEELEYHLALSGGLVMRIVSPNSPAHEAGIRPNDVVYSVNQQSVNTQEDLRAVISNFEPNEQIELNIISRGEAKKIPVSLAERPLQSKEVLPAQNEREGFLKNIIELAEPKREQQARERRSFGQILDGMGINRLLKEVSPTKNFNLNFQAQSSIKMMDGQGSVEIQVTDDGKHVLVRDANGNIQFEGPWNSEIEITSAPPEIQQRVKNINFQHESFNLRLPSREMR